MGEAPPTRWTSSFFATTLMESERAPSSSSIAEKLESRVIGDGDVHTVGSRCLSSVTFRLDAEELNSELCGSAFVFWYGRHPAGTSAPRTGRRDVATKCIDGCVYRKRENALLKKFLYGFRRKREIF